MFSACFTSHAYSPSLSHRPRSRCPLLSANLSASGGKRAALAWRDRQMKENKWRQRVMKQGAKWRRERYEDRCIYRERERESKKSEIFFSPWCLYWQFTLGALHCYLSPERQDQMCYTSLLLNLVLSHTLPNCPILFQFSLSPVCRCKVTGFLKWKAFLVQWSVVLWNSDSINKILNVVNYELKKSYVLLWWTVAYHICPATLHCHRWHWMLNYYTELL